MRKGGCTLLYPYKDCCKQTGTQGALRVDTGGGSAASQGRPGIARKPLEARREARSGFPPQPSEGASPAHMSISDTILTSRLLDLQNCEANTCLLSKTHCLWYFVTAAAGPSCRPSSHAFPSEPAVGQD